MDLRVSLLLRWLMVTALVTAAPDGPAGDGCQLVKVAAEDRENNRCFNEPECESVCHTVDTQVCTIIHRKECSPVTKEHCTKSSSPVCTAVSEEVCETVREPACSTVYEQACQRISEPQCRTVYEEQCSTVNQRDCQVVSQAQCETVLTPHCETYTDQQCQAQPRQVCQTNSKKECSILLLASDPWPDFHMHQVRVAPRYRDKSVNLPNQLAEKCLTKSANQQLRENATLCQNLIAPKLREKFPERNVGLWKKNIANISRSRPARRLLRRNVGQYRGRDVSRSLKLTA